jgi:glucose-1-phosphate adenylyltransferase
MRQGENWYQGTADAVYQNLNVIRDFRPDLIAVFGADHIYRMDLGQMVKFHMENRADVTIAALPVAVSAASSFGVIEVDHTQRLIGFDEKPKNPKPIPTDASRAYASMGNYLFETELLMDVLQEDAKWATEHDFGRTIIPELFSKRKVYAYDFLSNDVPGVKAYEEQGYWRDVGALPAYWQAHMDLLGARPAFDLHNRDWPILGAVYDGPPARILDGDIRDCLIGDGCWIEGGHLTRSVLGHGVRIGKGAEIEGAVIMDYAEIGEGVKLKGVIVDRYNAIPAGSEIGTGSGSGEDRYVREPSGLFVLERGETRSPA